MNDLDPYRVEWRSNLTTRWMLMGSAETREDADDLAERSLNRHGGFCRLVSQHVIATSPRPHEWVRP